MENLLIEGKGHGGGEFSPSLQKRMREILFRIYRAIFYVQSLPDKIFRASYQRAVVISLEHSELEDYKFEALNGILEKISGRKRVISMEFEEECGAIKMEELYQFHKGRIVDFDRRNYLKGLISRSKILSDTIKSIRGLEKDGYSEKEILELITYFEG